MQKPPISSLGQPSYSLNFKELNNLIYKYSSKLSQLDIHTLNTFFLQSLNPENTIKTLKEALNQPTIQLNPHTVETLLQNIWKRILVRNNIIIIIIKILQISCRFLTPYLLDELTNNFKIEDQDHSVEIFGLGTTISLQTLNWIYAIILVFIMVFGVFLDTQQTWHLNRLRYQGKTVLQFLLYYKLVVAKSVEGGGSDANLNNLVSSDCDTFVNIFYNFHEAWASLVNLAAIIVILFFKMRKALPIGLAVVFILLWLTSRVSKGMAKLNPEILKIRDKRIELTGDIVQGIKSIKYLCWEAVFQGKLLELRKREFDLISKMKYLDSFCVILWGLTSISIITATFIAYSLMGYDIVKVNVFTDIAYFQMLIAPLNSLPWTIGAVVNSLNALSRVKSYLGKEELERSKENIEGVGLKMKIKRMTWPQIDQEKAFFALKNIDLELKEGSLNMVIGSVSAGKSALLNAILDEMKPLTKKEEELMSPEGFVNSPLLPETQQLNQISVKGKIAYVSQNPWLQKQTIRENILFGKQYEPVFYRKCLEACDLVADIKKLSDGDNHGNERLREIYDPFLDVGLNGLNLSGGQRQRISLCRALYQDADIYLLDDILSSVDVSVANILFQKAVINLLKERNKTIILVLSQYKYLRYADRVLLIQRGQVLENSLSIKSFLESSGNEYNASPGISPSLLVDSKPPMLLGEEKSEEEEEFQAKEENKEEILRGGVKIQTLLAFINAMGTFVFLLIWIGGILMQGSRAWFDFWLKDYIACKAQGETPGFFLVNFEVTLVVLMIFSVACWAFRAMIFAYGNLKAGERLFKMLVPRVLYAPMEFFDRNPIGKVVQRFSEDTWTLDYEFAFRWNMLLNNLMIFARVLYVFAINVPVILTLMLPGATIFYSLQDKYRKVSRELKRMDSISQENLLNHLAETIAGTVVIRAFQKEQFMIQGFLGKVKEALITRSIMETMRIWFSLRLKSLSILVSSLVLLFSLGYKYYYGNTANFSDLSLILLYALTSPLNFEDIMITLADSERELIGIERINEYLTNPTENAKDMISSESITKLSSEIIQFKNISLKYQKDKNDYTLRNLSLSISKNEKIALCGRTGSGKTTVLNALLRLYEAESGNIRFKGRDIQDMSVKELRSNIAVIPQFGFMYEAGLLENLDPYGIINGEKMDEVLKKGREIVEKAVRKSEEETEENETEDKVELFDKKFVIERGGQNLSNGEKQLVSFLRILLKDSDVIFLDEATSNVDPTTDELMHKALFEMSEGKTLIVITHRLEYLKHYDRIILMENGEIVDQGTYQEITNKPDGKLRRFIEENSRS